jgi:ATP-binding cassette, subfamily B, bacterial
MKFIPQHNMMDCGPACLAMISAAYGKKYSLQYLRDHSFISRDGVSMQGIIEAADKIGFKTVPVKMTLEKLADMHMPCILHWSKNHFVVLSKIKGKFTHEASERGIFNKRIRFYLADPAHGKISIGKEAFQKSWISDGDAGVALFLYPTDAFYASKPPITHQVNTRYILSLFKAHKRQFSYMLICLFLGTVISLVLPFLTRYLIDSGVSGKNIGIIKLVLMAQIGIFLGAMMLEIIRNWVMLYVGTKINIEIISRFLYKLLKLPIRFFDTKLMGDFNQRIQDHERIETFLKSSSLISVFSVFMLSVSIGILGYFDYKILVVYFIFTTAALAWSLLFLSRRKILDYYRFQSKSENQASIYEIINGVTEMKLNQFEDYKRSEWELIQKKLFKINIRILKVDQIQIGGFELINQLKNIVVTYLAAVSVVNGRMTIGELLSISYIIGQMVGPLNQLTSFFRSLQDAKLSLERLNEVQNYADEEQPGQKILPSIKGSNSSVTAVHSETGIRLDNVSFQYEGPLSPFVLKDINMVLPKGKITAIVGSSGSGKTTLMKLLLKFYEANSGCIYFDGEGLTGISPLSLRQNCGVVMQDGYIFSDTIQRNIVTADIDIDEEKYKKAIRIANIEEFISALPLRGNTKIGASGNGISGGQKQRILIARAVYKNPHYIFLDEATSALDSENEKKIHDNLLEFFKHKTVLIIAHRLSTVKNADQIIVLKNGRITEIGAHQQLVDRRGDYFNLVRNQLELGM